MSEFSSLAAQNAKPLVAPYDTIFYRSTDDPKATELEVLATGFLPCLPYEGMKFQFDTEGETFIFHHFTMRLSNPVALLVAVYKWGTYKPLKVKTP